MCPEGSKRTFNGKAVFACIAAVLVLFTGFLIYRFVFLRPIPELRRIAELEVDRYDESCVSYDGKHFVYVSHNINDRDDFNKEVRAIQRFCSARGTKVTGWTPDKITFPVYSLTIRPVIFKSEQYVHGETFVWSNGYLITSSGDVYRCDPGFKYFIESDENDYVREADAADTLMNRSFRPLHMANNEWNKDMLNPANVSGYAFTDDVEATVTSVTGDEDARVVSVNVKNNGTRKWYYSDQSMYVGVEVQLDGEWYDVLHDPNVDDNFLSSLSCSKTLDAGQDINVNFHLGFYGKLPPGDYRIVIYGQGIDSSSWSECAAAEYRI